MTQIKIYDDDYYRLEALSARFNSTIPEIVAEALYEYADGIDGMEQDIEKVRRRYEDPDFDEDDEDEEIEDGV